MNKKIANLTTEADRKQIEKIVLDHADASVVTIDGARVNVLLNYSDTDIGECVFTKTDAKEKDIVQNTTEMIVSEWVPEHVEEISEELDRTYSHIEVPINFLADGEGIHENVRVAALRSLTANNDYTVDELEAVLSR